MSLILGLIVIVLIAWKLTDYSWRGWVGLYIYLGIKKRRSIDASHLQLLPSPETQEHITTLVSMGFHRLGEAQVKLPYYKKVTTWILVDSENKVQAETAWGHLSFSTFFQDNVWVVTDYQQGEYIETPTWQSHTITTGISDTYQYHLQQVIKFSQNYGSPNLIQNITDYIRWDTMVRINYGALKLKRFLWLYVVQLLAFAYGGLIIILLPTLYLTKPSFLSAISEFSGEQIQLLTILLTLPAVFLTNIYSRSVFAKSRQNSADK